MISSGYSIHLYCSCEACRTSPAGRMFNGGFQEFAEPTKSRTLRSARQAGWRIDWKGQRCWAPKHIKRATDTAEL